MIRAEFESLQPGDVVHYYKDSQLTWVVHVQPSNIGDDPRRSKVFRWVHVRISPDTDDDDVNTIVYADVTTHMCNGWTVVVPERPCL